MKFAAAVLVAGILAPGVACAIDQGLGGHIGVNIGYSFAGNSDSGGSAAINGGYWAAVDGPVVANAAKQDLNPKGVDFGGEVGVHYRVGDLVPGLDIGFAATGCGTPPAFTPPIRPTPTVSMSIRPSKPTGC